jgi:hypothetical protein
MPKHRCEGIIEFLFGTILLFLIHSILLLTTYFRKNSDHSFGERITHPRKPRKLRCKEPLDSLLHLEESQLFCFEFRLNLLLVPDICS